MSQVKYSDAKAKAAKIKAVSDVVSEMKREIERLQKENTDLEADVDDLDSENAKLKKEFRGSDPNEASISPLRMSDTYVRSRADNLYRYNDITDIDTLIYFMPAPTVTMT